MHCHKLSHKLHHLADQAWLTLLDIAQNELNINQAGKLTACLQAEAKL